MMKRRIAALALMVVTAMAAVPVTAQSLVRFGVKGGLELTEMDFSADALRESNRAGFYVGPVVKFQLPVVGLGLDAAPLYSLRTLKVEGEKLTQQSLVVPVHARYGANVGDLLGVFLCAGPQFSFNLGDDILYWKDNDGNNKQFSLQNTMLSVNLGAGVTIGGHLEASIFYNIPLGKTADFTWDELGSRLSEQSWKRAKSRTNAWHLALVYYF